MQVYLLIGAHLNSFFCICFAEIKSKIAPFKFPFQFVMIMQIATQQLRPFEQITALEGNAECGLLKTSRLSEGVMRLLLKKLFDALGND